MKISGHQIEKSLKTSNQTESHLQSHKTGKSLSVKRAIQKVPESVRKIIGKGLKASLKR